jgi:prophage regulatory protein
MDDETPQFAGAHEIRDLLGVSRQRVYQLARRSDFPEPIAILAQGKVWLVSEIEAWIGTHRSAPRTARSKPTKPRHVTRGIHDRS